MKRLLSGPRDANCPRDYYLLSLAYYLALRGAEAVSLRPEHFRLKEGEAYIPSVKFKSGGKGLTCKATGRPLIMVPILFGMDVIRAAINWAYSNESEWMFPSRGDKEHHIGSRQFRTTFSRWRTVAGLDPLFSAHSLRHSAGTHINEIAGESIRRTGGDSLILVRDFMRHQDAKTTSVYLHTTPETIKIARLAMLGTKNRESGA